MATTKIYRVVSCGEMETVQRRNADEGLLNKRNIVLKEMGDNWADELAATLLGNNAQLQFYKGDMVAATLRFTAKEYKDKYYQEVTVTDIMKLNH
ncbi:MAG: DUF3127 domain-containing protein [Prevotellaceae bacterium]|nr:DUF3127 domain-containing protein [Prevotellaceae bacterium]